MDGKSESGAKKAWRQMLLQFHNVSADVADAIVSQYPSMRSLRRAYQRPCSTGEKELLLADLIIRRGIGSLENCRRVGPELSKKVFKLMTCKSKDDVLVY